MLVLFFIFTISHPKVFCKKAILKSHAKSTETPTMAFFSQKGAPSYAFSCELYEIFNNNYSIVTTANSCFCICRSNRSQMFFCWPRPVTLLKKKLQRKCFPVNIAKFFRTAFFNRTTLVVASAYIAYD